MRVLCENKWSEPNPQAMCECVDGIEKVVFEKLEKLDKDDPQEYVFAFFSNYLGGKRNRFKAIWNLLRGKETWYAEALVPEEDVIRFLAECKRIVQKEF